jgi:hypothetical protein
MIVLYGTPGVIGIVFIALTKRLFGERESAHRFQLCVLDPRQTQHLLAGLTAYGRFPNNHGCETPDSPLARLPPRGGEAMKMTRPKTPEKKPGAQSLICSLLLVCDRVIEIPGCHGLRD